MAWNPWRTLKDRDDITLLRRRLIGADALLLPGPPWRVVLDDRLGRRERNAALAHELVHLERGGGPPRRGMPETWQAIAAREEERVDDEVARRLVPPAELARYVRQCAEVGEYVTVFSIAEEFDVPEWVAHVAAHRGAATASES